ncbi:DUF4019 domain-containing protein [Sphingomonas sp. GB1N7]|uniref:DUF4019 domain-containing protein n=1 Tax=Parasphingomonas caseinilytica TaxID=3096158 RepID=UPI002FC6B23A
MAIDKERTIMRASRMLWAAVALSACSAGADLPTADKAVARFHGMIDAGEFQQVYDQASTDLKASASSAKLIALLGAVHRKLGRSKGAVRQSWNDQFNTGGHFLTVGYDTKYERGRATETFVFKVSEGAMQLAGYNVNSDALVLN